MQHLLADDLVAKRMLSPHCKTELFELEWPIGYCALYVYDLIKTLQNEYVSCKYADCNDLSVLNDRSVRGFNKMVSGIQQWTRFLQAHFPCSVENNSQNANNNGDESI